MSTRVRPPAKCHDVFKIFRAPAARPAYSNSPSPSSLTWLTPSSSRSCTLALPCTMWTAPWLHPDFSGPRSKPTRVHPSPSLVHRYESFAWPWPHLSTATSHPISAHHELRDTLNPRNIVNHSSSKGNHHWSSHWYLRVKWENYNIPDDIKWSEWHFRISLRI